MNERIIHTGLYTEFAEKFITCCIDKCGQIPGLTWKKFNRVKCVRTPNGEVVLDGGKVNTCSTIFKYRTQQDALIWLARTFKHLTLHGYLTDRNSIEWSRTNTASNPYIKANGFQPTIQDTYCIYDILVGRKRLELKYSKDYLSKIVGIERDDISTALETERRQRISEIKNKYLKPIYDADPNSYGKAYNKISKRVNEFKAQLVAEYQQRLDEIIKQRDQEIVAVNDMADAALNGQAVFMFA